jgi:drug/metabolite transporter (DMT)-like permease
VLLDGGVELPTEPRGWIGVTGNAVSYAVGLTCLFAAIRRLGAIRTAIAANLEPVISVTLAALVLGEALSAPQAMGALVVLAGILLAQSDRRPVR